MHRTIRHPGHSRHATGRLLLALLAGVMLVLALGLTPASAGTSNPDAQPCDPDPITDGWCDDDIDPSPRQRVAIGRDRSSVVAYAEAQAEATAMCFGDYDVVRPPDFEQLASGVWKVTLTYTC
jgi:hypothetical protein